MIKIKFRGKSEITGQFVFGTYIAGYIINGVIEANSEYISIEEWVPVYEKTVSQFIGLKDKNGIEVYVGDIVRCSRGCSHEVIWLQEHGGTFIGGMPTWYLSQMMPGYAWTNSEEVIGNIYQNPELLEGAHAK